MFHSHSSGCPKELLAQTRMIFANLPPKSRKIKGTATLRGFFASPPVIQSCPFFNISTFQPFNFSTTPKARAPRVSRCLPPRLLLDVPLHLTTREPKKSHAETRRPRRGLGGGGGEKVLFPTLALVCCIGACCGGVAGGLHPNHSTMHCHPWLRGVRANDDVRRGGAGSEIQIR